MKPTLFLLGLLLSSCASCQPTVETTAEPEPIEQLASYARSPMYFDPCLKPPKSIDRMILCTCMWYPEFSDRCCAYNMTAGAPAVDVWCQQDCLSDWRFKQRRPGTCQPGVW